MDRVMACVPVTLGLAEFKAENAVHELEPSPRICRWTPRCPQHAPDQSAQRDFHIWLFWDVNPWSMSHQCREGADSWLSAASALAS